MFQRMQELVRLNDSLVRDYSSRDGHKKDESAPDCSSSNASEEFEDNDVEKEERLRMIIVQQAQELKTLRRIQRDVMADGQVRHPATSHWDNQRVDDEEDQGVLQVGSDGEDTDNETDTPTNCATAADLVACQLKGKTSSCSDSADHCQVGIAIQKLIDRKRFMEQNFQQEGLERQLRELKQYVDCLEKKIVDLLAIDADPTDKPSIQDVREYMHASPLASLQPAPSVGCFKDAYQWMLQAAERISVIIPLSQSTHR
ncbi:hypothetical protein GQ600_12397 [Phytophthora cactorum]|nr:hypothetical protein GQ600_12397 [Phytophthora cactorum]